MFDIAVQEPKQLNQYVRQLSNNEVGLLITLFRLTDKWPTNTKSDTLQKSHAHVLRLYLQSLFDYYLDTGQKNKSRLATTLYATMLYAEAEGLTHIQIATIQTVLTYFQRVKLTIDDLWTCTQLLWDNDIETTPEMPN
ncbi:MAG: hypothetical protein AAF639_10490 [Chloroflexota bacterium]